jgi:hypothetical protein
MPQNLPDHCANVLAGWARIVCHPACPPALPVRLPVGLPACLPAAHHATHLPTFVNPYSPTQYSK